MLDTCVGTGVHDGPCAGNWFFRETLELNVNNNPRQELNLSGNFMHRLRQSSSEIAFEIVKTSGAYPVVAIFSNIPFMQGARKISKFIPAENAVVMIPIFRRRYLLFYTQSLSCQITFLAAQSPIIFFNHCIFSTLFF